MKTIFDIQQYLKQFGTIIYIGDREADLDLMGTELHELYQAQLMEEKEYQIAMLILKQEMNKIRNKEL
ncbi:YqgQ family protein [Bacillus sp. 03113]|uniref:YqgQ family protein n=1 Tax=Bacillus sp. 03113 TaxID=2578211 RepID=UPI0011419F4C|nr:YqgQ family protein [Bacillus sp. 03113]